MKLKGYEVCFDYNNRMFVEESALPAILECLKVEGLTAYMTVQCEIEEEGYSEPILRMSAVGYDCVFTHHKQPDPDNIFLHDFWVFIEDSSMNDTAKHNRVFRFLMSQGYVYDGCYRWGSPVIRRMIRDRGSMASKEDLSGLRALCDDLIAYDNRQTAIVEKIKRGTLNFTCSTQKNYMRDYNMVNDVLKDYETITSPE